MAVIRGPNLRDMIRPSDQKMISIADTVIEQNIPKRVIVWVLILLCTGQRSDSKNDTRKYHC